MPSSFNVDGKTSSCSRCRYSSAIPINKKWLNNPITPDSTPSLCWYSRPLMDQSSKDFHCSCICCFAYSTHLCNIEVFLITTLANCGFVRSTDRIQHICQGHLHNFCCNCSLYGQVHLFLCRILTAVV